MQTHRDWLLILDNADGLALLQDFLPPTSGGQLLLTTRAAATGRLAHRMEIETLLPEHGALFLLRRAALLAPDATLEQASQEERELAVQISQELGGLPLALDQAGAYLEETGMVLASWWYIYQQHRADLLQKRGGLVTDHPAPVATTWSLSFQKAEEREPTSADLLRLCAYLAPDAIAEEILTAGASLFGPVLALVAADAFQLNQTIEALRAYSLVRRDPRGETLSIHRLIQAVLQDTLEEKERRTWGERAILAVNAAFPECEHNTWPQCERLLPQTLATAQLIERYQLTIQEAGRLLHNDAHYLYERARYQQAEPLYQRALRIREQALGPQHHETAETMHELARLREAQGNSEEVRTWYAHALAVREQAFGAHHPKTTETRKCFIALLHALGKHEQAAHLKRDQAE